METLNAAKREIIKLSLMNGEMAFASSILFLVDIKLDPKNKELPLTGKTDGNTIWLGNKWYTSNNYAALLLHCVLHVMLDHPARSVEFSNKDLYETAADIVVLRLLRLVNLSLANWYVKELDDLVRRFHIKPTDTTEQIYNKFKVSNTMSKPDGTDHSLVVPEVLNNNTVLQAVANSVDVGSISNEELKRIIKDLLEPTVSWGVQAQSCRGKVKKVNNWFRPLPWFTDIVIPSKRYVGVDSVDLYFDTSYSIDEKKFITLLSEGEGFIDSIKPNKINISCWGSSIVSKSSHKYPFHVVDAKYVSGGGTNILPVMNQIIKDRPTLAIVFTDSEFVDQVELYEQVIQNTELYWVVFGENIREMPVGVTLKI